MDSAWPSPYRLFFHDAARRFGSVTLLPRFCREPWKNDQPTALLAWRVWSVAMAMSSACFSPCLQMYSSRVWPSPLVSAHCLCPVGPEAGRSPAVALGPLGRHGLPMYQYWIFTDVVS